MTLKVQKKRCWGDGRRASNLQKRGKERMLTCSIICACALTRLTPLSLFFCQFPPSFFPGSHTCPSEMINSPETLVAPLPSCTGDSLIHKRTHQGARTAKRRMHACTHAPKWRCGDSLPHACVHWHNCAIDQPPECQAVQSDPPPPPTFLPPSTHCLPVKVAKLTP